MEDKSSILGKAIPLFPFLAQLAPALQAEFCQQAQLMTLPPGQFICLEGDTCTHLVLMLAGSARIYKMGDSGREITLYRLEPGESCIMTASCILSTQTFPAFAVTETVVEGIGLPAPVLQHWMSHEAVWQQYVFGLLSQRLIQVMDVLEDVVFHRMDSRIAAYLLSLVSPSHSEIQITHEAIASELGSSREVVSRLLKDMEKREMLILSRGMIRVVNPRALAHLAQ
ncbi:Crp/Fnr family transcriptional regulator [Lyngbya confervoides]|uniref:Crp/Fnr family transcriptional regulator n=1 Tax=Lyngbya confervoides BDU141951 TaxID=1574623 RepID=A0ABD4T549_9CYAN|nr:Crp/Fnr family transcriptional regulator [Lyngbya confervoides]MCM1983784.1 Crp/Fnr family transcriptional regulator [Lyngbya confervoides BDU141951]